MPATLYFSYGSLKRGFPNHGDFSRVLGDFVGEAITCEPMPLIVPYEPNCSNPNCPWLHRMPTLVNLSGEGKPVRGEVFRVSETALEQLDRLEGYLGPDNPSNVYERRDIRVQLGGKTETVSAYVIADPEPRLREWQEGKAEAVEDYTLEMAAVTPKPTAN